MTASFILSQASASGSRSSCLLKELEESGYIPPKTECSWRVPGDEAVPDPQDGERVMLASHSLRGMSLPLSAFFLGVEDTLLADIRETFDSLNRYSIKLNPSKCVFGVPSG